MRRQGWTNQYEYQVLVVLNSTDGPLHLAAIYRGVSENLRRDKLLCQGEDYEWRTRWVLSNMAKKELVKNTDPHTGQWQITDRGREWLRPIPEDFGDDLV